MTKAATDTGAAGKGAIENDTAAADKLPEKAATDKAGANTGKPRDEAVANKVTALVAASNAKAATELVELKPGFCREPAHYRAQ